MAKFTPLVVGTTRIGTDPDDHLEPGDVLNCPGYGKVTVQARTPSPWATFPEHQILLTNKDKDLGSCTRVLPEWVQKAAMRAGLRPDNFVLVVSERTLSFTLVSREE